MPKGILQTSSVNNATGLATRTNTYPRTRMSQNAEASFVQQNQLPARVDLRGKLKDMPVCPEDPSGAITHCRSDTCKCGWGTQCYPKFQEGEASTSRVDVGVCDTSMTVLAVLSVLLFATVMATFVSIRSFLQSRAMDDVEWDADKPPIVPAAARNPAAGTTSTTDSSSDSDSDQEEAPLARSWAPALSTIGSEEPNSWHRLGHQSSAPEAKSLEGTEDAGPTSAAGSSFSEPSTWHSGVPGGSTRSDANQDAAASPEPSPKPCLDQETFAI